MAESGEGRREGIVAEGIGVAPGLARGKVFLLRMPDDRIVERDIAEEEIPREIARLEDALIATREQLHEVQRKINEAIGHEGASIFDAHLLVVDDRAFVEEVIRALKGDRRNVEAVLVKVAERYAEALAGVEDDYLRERAADIRDVTRRILRNLAGLGGSVLSDVSERSVLVAKDLPPSETGGLDRERVLGLATDLGSETSHTAIMARAMEIPAVVGLHDLTVRVNPGDDIMIDGTKGLVVINPTPDQVAAFEQRDSSRREIETQLKVLRQKPAETRDAYSLLLSANIEDPSEVDAVITYGALGVGLYRTEYLYLSANRLPTEQEQYEAYRLVAERLAPHPVVIRTVDLGGDKFASHIRMPPEVNPFMGWRAIRFCLAQPDIFNTQLRAILRASVAENVKIMYPMISNVGEVLRANEALEAAKVELRAEGVRFNEDLDIGVMIEVPSAALTADLIAPHVDFFSLGTNDLVQYTLAVDRVNERIAHLYQPTHPAILKLIRNTIEVGHQHGIWVGVCGEMAANPMLALLLMGLGVDELSVSPPQVPVVKDAVRSVSYGEVEDLAERALVSGSETEVLDLCRKLVADTAPEILELVR